MLLNLRLLDIHQHPLCLHLCLVIVELAQQLHRHQAVVAVMVVKVMLDDIAVVVLVFVVDVIVDTVMNVVKFLVDVGGMAVRVVESRSDTRPV